MTQQPNRIVRTNLPSANHTGDRTYHRPQFPLLPQTTALSQPLPPVTDPSQDLIQHRLQVKQRQANRKKHIHRIAWVLVLLLGAAFAVIGLLKSGWWFLLFEEIALCIGVIAAAYAQYTSVKRQHHGQVVHHASVDLPGYLFWIMFVVVLVIFILACAINGDGAIAGDTPIWTVGCLLCNFFVFSASLVWQPAH